MGVSFFAPASDRGVWTSGSALQANSHEHLSMHWQTSSFPATKSSVGRWVPTKAGGAARVLRRIGWHQVEVTATGAVPLARSQFCLQAVRLGGPAWALQFHPEGSRADALH